MEVFEDGSVDKWWVRPIKGTWILEERTKVADALQTAANPRAVSAGN